MDSFLAWMKTLDAVEVARTNSFHSLAHRDEMQRHDLDKRGRAVTESRHMRVLVDVGQMWANRDLKAMNKKNTTVQRIENNPTKEVVTA